MKTNWVFTMVALTGISAAMPARAAMGANTLVYFDGHMHTTHSDGSGSIADIKTAARARGLHAVIVTNHTKQIVDLEEWNEIVATCQALSEDEFLMIPSFEVTGSEGMFNRDHVLAWGVYDPFVGDDALALAPEEVWQSPLNLEGTGPLYPENIRKWVDYIHEHNGLAVHAHTSGNTQPDYGVDFIELYNLSHVKDVARYAGEMDYEEEAAWGLGTLFNNFAINGNRDLYQTYDFMGTAMPLKQLLYVATGQLNGVGEWLDAPEAAPLHSWDDLLMAYLDGRSAAPVFGVASSDAHNTANVDMENSAIDNSDVGEVKNGVYLERLTREDLFAAIRRGNLFATTGPSLAFEVNGRMMGETVELCRPCDRLNDAHISLKTDSQSPSSVLVEVKIIRNGQVIHTAHPMAATCQIELEDANVAEKCYYRAEVVALDASDNRYRFAWANPVFVEPTDALPLGDLNGDCCVDLQDLAILAGQWMKGVH